MRGSDCGSFAKGDRAQNIERARHGQLDRRILAILCLAREQNGC